MVITCVVLLGLVWFVERIYLRIIIVNSCRGISWRRHKKVTQNVRLL